MTAPTKYTRTERTLHKGAELHMPGTGDHLVAVYRCAKDLRMAATIKVFLFDANDGKTLADMRDQLEAYRSSRRGPKHDRYESAIDAMAELEKMVTE